MTKVEFINELYKNLSDYPSEETAKSIQYYSEMIEDRIEDGMTEEEAVNSLGSVSDIVTQIKMELPFTALVKANTKKKKLSTAAIVILIVLFPVWLTLGIAIFSALFGLFVAVWSVVFSFWVTGIALAASAIVCLAACGAAIFTGSPLVSLFGFGSFLLVTGAAILIIIGSYYLTVGAAKLCSLTVRLIKKCLS